MLSFPSNDNRACSTRMVYAIRAPRGCLYVLRAARGIQQSKLRTSHLWALGPWAPEGSLYVHVTEGEFRSWGP